MAGKSKSLFGSKTVWTGALFLAAYFTVKFFLVPSPDETDPLLTKQQVASLLQTIMVVGVAGMAIFLRQGLISMLDSQPRFDQPQSASAPASDDKADAGPPDESGVPARALKNKPLWRSKTFLTAVLLLVAHFGARYYHLPPEQIQAIFIVGTVFLVIFLRHGMLSAHAD